MVTTRLKTRIALITLIGSMLPFVATADEEKARQGRVMWTAFECSMLANLANKNEAARHHFEIGVEAGREFIRAIEDKEITDKELGTLVPIGVTMILQGPSADFIVGRIYESASGHAHDRVVKNDYAGLPLDTKDWLLDEDVMSSKAISLYSKSNCELLK